MPFFSAGGDDCGVIFVKGQLRENLPYDQMTSSYNFARFGIASTSTHGGSFEIDYIRWTTDGVFAPYVPPAGTIVIFK